MVFQRNSMLMIAVKIFILLIASHVKCEKFYIYDWPAELDDVWPPRSTTVKYNSYNHDFREHNGAGRMLNKDYGLFQTWFR